MTPLGRACVSALPPCRCCSQHRRELRWRANQFSSEDRGAPGPGFSLIELVMVVAIILIITAIAVPSFLRVRITAHEGATVENLRTITSAQVVYFAAYNNGYAPGLPTLGGSGALSCDSAQLIDIPLSQGVKSGYRYTYTGLNALPNPAPGCNTPGYTSYQLRADPQNPGVSGQRHFYTDATGIIRQNGGAPAGPADPPIG